MIIHTQSASSNPNSAYCAITWYCSGPSQRQQNFNQLRAVILLFLVSAHLHSVGLERRLQTPAPVTSTGNYKILSGFAREQRREFKLG